jgi:ligand-binding SRPBCC domain-containing protein
MLFVKESLIKASPERVFGFHERQDALALLTPPWENARIVQTARIAEVGSQAIIEARLFGPIKVRWVAEHTVYCPPHSFEDVQLRGPFRSWRHRHIVETHPDGAILRDEITYEPPFGRLGKLVAPLIEKRLERLFAYRHEVTRECCERSEVG